MCHVKPYCCRTCYFGCRWAACWFSRVEFFLDRHLHRWITSDMACGFASMLPWVFLCCGRTLALVRNWSGPVGDSAVLFGSAVRPSSKLDRPVSVLYPLCVDGAKVSKNDVEELVGVLVWCTRGGSVLRPWLQALYHLLRRPFLIFRSVLSHRLRSLPESLPANHGHLPRLETLRDRK